MQEAESLSLSLSLSLPNTVLVGGRQVNVLVALVGPAAEVAVERDAGITAEEQAWMDLEESLCKGRLHPCGCLSSLDLSMWPTTDWEVLCIGAVSEDGLVSNKGPVAGRRLTISCHRSNQG